MAQSKVQTNEKEKMVAFKQSLVSRIENALLPTEPEVIPEKIVLRIPSEYENLSEIELYKKLTLNTKFQHTPQTAILAIEALKNISHVSELEKSLEQYKLDLIDLIDRIETTEHKIEECLFNNSSNIELIIVDNEVEEENIEVEDFEPINIKEDGTIIYKVPADFETMTEPQLVFTLYTDFHYTKRVASDLHAVLSGKISKPTNMEFELV